MESVRHKLISLGLATLYLALATAGDALHSLLPCPDTAYAVGRGACDCGHAHFDWSGAKSQARDGVNFSAPRLGHDSSTCAICGVLGQLKVATSISAPAAEIAAPIVNVSVAMAPVRAHSVSRLHAARGPPTLSV